MLLKSYNLRMTDDPFKDLINLEKASEFSGLSRDHLRRLMEQGSIKGKKIGRDWITTIYYVEEYLNRNIKPGIPPKDLE